MIRGFTGIVVSLLLATAARADCTVISGVVAHTPEGPRRGVSVVIDGGRIAGVGLGLDGLDLVLDGQSRIATATWRGAACVFVQGGGMQVTPGLIEVQSQLGLVEVALERQTLDADAGGDAVRAALRVADAYNPRSSLVPVQRIGGVTGALVVPTGGLVAGQGAFVQLAGSTQAEAVVAPSVALYASLRATPSRAGTLAALAELLDDARSFGRRPTDYKRNALRPSTEGVSAADLRALQPLLAREQPLVVHADRAADIEALLRFAEQQRIRLVVAGAAEAWLLAADLAEAEVPVILDPYVYGPGGFDQVHARADNPALLAEAGVTLILSTSSSHNARNLPQIAGNAVRAGLDHDVAIRAITEHPAAAFGLSERGRLEPGAVADVVVWSGDPLELSSRPEAVWIAGRRIPMESRQTKLRDAYRDLPGTPRPPPSTGE